MEKEVLVRADKVSKKFSKDLKKSLKYGLQDIFRELLGKPRKKDLRPSEFLAADEVSFELRRGDCLGLIGHNGAGKSTLLKMLNGLIKPDSGRIEIYGRVAALIELGAGFNPILSGRENIYNNGSVLGFTKEEVDEKIDEIIEFSELESFIDAPVQSYSSGMKVRLGFAVAAQMDPDVLIIDEVLAVGDLGFRLKCLKRIDEILPKTAVIFVSHSMPMISRVCTQAILLGKGKVIYSGGDVSKCIDWYYEKFDGDRLKQVVFDSGKIRLDQIKLNAEEKSPKIGWLDDVEFELKFTNFELQRVPFVNLTFYDKERRGVAVIKSRDLGYSIGQGVFVLKISVDKLQFSKGVYSMSIAVSERRGSSLLLRVNDVLEFQVFHEYETWPPFLLDHKINLES